jgi:hypothetical protein
MAWSPSRDDGIARVGDPAPEVTVVIVSYRCRDHLLACLDSLALQRTGVDLVVDVVDSGSGDDTAVAAAHAHPWVNIEALDDNVGFARANNRAVARAIGRAVLILNPDTVLPPGALRACLDELWRNPDVGVLTPRLVTPDGEFDRRCKRGFPTPWASFCYFSGLDRYLRGRRSRRYTGGHLDEHEAGDVEIISGAFMLARREVLQGLGGFDEDLPMYAEDLDLSMRFAEAGWRVRYWPGVDVVHVGGGSGQSGRRTAVANAAYFRAYGPFMRRHLPGPRGRITAAAGTLAGEALLLVSRLLRAVRRV